MKNTNHRGLTIFPTIHYNLEESEPPDLFRGGARRITHRGRSGWVLDDVHGGMVLGVHTLAAEAGAISIWVMALEDLHTAQKLPQHSQSFDHADEFALWSDRDTMGDGRPAHAALTWSSFWHPSLYVKRGPGYVYDCYTAAQPFAVAAAGHWHFDAGRWVQLTYVWDRDGLHRLYANGVLVGCCDTSPSGPGRCAEPGPFLCVGSTLFATGNVACYDEVLTAGQVAEIHRAETTDPDPELQRQFAAMYEGADLTPFDAPEDDGWQDTLDLDLRQTDHLRRFHIQGCPHATSIDDEGLRITTPQKDPSHDFSKLDLSHVYCWSRDWFEGDLHLSYSFQNLREGGLSLLMTQCSGMRREDPWTCHPNRVNGTMRTVCWEDMRNYHWEYLREMNDVRNDVASHALLKNPWFRPLGFRVHGPRYEIGSWHRLDFCQEGQRIRCAIDGDCLIDTRDRPDDNNGPTLSAGRIAIRCMTRTDIRFRDLKVRTRPIYG